jgi:hypothetical protein
MSQLLGTQIQYADFWGWLAFAAIILGLEIFVGTQWLLWIAGAAGMVAVVTLLPFEMGLFSQLMVFVVIATAAVFASKRLIKETKPTHDVNDPSRRMIGAHAAVLTGFNQGHGDRVGQVTFDGVVWPAVMMDEVPKHLKVDDQVIIHDHREGKLYVKALKD